MASACIETDSLTRSFGHKKALDNFTLSVAEGGIHAIVGSNGAGKSTLFRLLLGMDTPTSGSCHVLGKNSQHLSPGDRGRVGYVNEEHTLPDWMTVESVIALQRGFYPKWQQIVFDRTVSYFDIDSKQKITGLSRGERAGLSLSLALAQQPDLLILDEPTLGLDVVAKQSFLESLLFIGTEHQASIIYCSHQMEEIERVADNLILMEQGRLINNSAPEDFVARIASWSVDFDGKPFDPAAIPGFLSSRNIEGRHHIVVADCKADFASYLKHQGATFMQPLPINLESAVNAFLTRNHSKPLEL
ncbi:ABC transporter ATP-binding protein [Planctobacterium marinum]|uniref:ABC transporter ATP-binding protein n=1 Tax=Planctobacterium marinum TaxID=1631968 RepID=A0AA48KSX7_9ALTE|nr:ABC transporter ATP-binding protein [Planctobacterium marinum]